jgi:hypothetical protein
MAQQGVNDPVSVWWYPNGNIEGTRQNVAPTAAQPAATLAIKWRTPLLKGSPVILAGALLNRPNAGEQEIIGAVGNKDLAIVSPFGLLLKLYPYDTEFPGLQRLLPTGLFNVAATSPLPSGRADRIGVGIERTQQTGVRLAGVLADTGGKPRDLLTIDPLAAGSGSRVAGIYPIAAYTPGGGPIALACITQDSYAAPYTIPPANSVRAYALNGGMATTSWIYPIAPSTYPIPPSILYDERRSRDSAFIGISTASASYAPPANVVPNPGPPVMGRPTWSDSAYSIYLGANPLGPRNYATDPITGDDGHGAMHTYFVTLFGSSIVSGTVYRVITENFDPSHPGTASLRLVSTTAADSTDTLYVDREMTGRGWRIVTGDIDKGSSGSNRNYLNNFGNELIGAWSLPDDRDMATNWLYIFRRNEQISPDTPFALFARQFFSGRLLAAGDLVTNQIAGIDNRERQELVIADHDSVSILEMLDYNDPSSAFVNPPANPFDARYFRTLRTFHLDSRVISAAIADIEGDGNNDLIVTTEGYTYAIGLRTPIPFGELIANKGAYCKGDTIRVSWNRRVGGGESGVRVRLVGPETKLLAEGRVRTPSTDALNPGIGPDTLTLATGDLTPGSYRIRVEDMALDSLYEETASFSVNQPLITPVAVDTGTSFHFGSTIRLSTTLACADAALLLRSTDAGAHWDTVRSVTMSGDRVEASQELDCQAWCGDQQGVAVLYRFIDSRGYASSDTVSLALAAPGRVLGLVPGDSSRARRRTVTWKSGDFLCDKLTLSIIGQGKTVTIPNVPASALEYPIEVPEEMTGTIRVRLCCEARNESSCEYALSPEFEVNKIPDGNYVAPNPFNPNDQSIPSGNGAAIVYRLKVTANVNITIFDASRTVTRRLMEGVEMEGGKRQIAFWDGRNSRGEIVANGTYICVIESGSGEHIVLPVIVMKR